MAGMGADKPASTSSRKAFVWASSVASKANSRELPASAWREEVTVRGSAVPARRRAACPLQHELAAHELAIVLAHSPFGGRVARVGREGALGPLPHIAEHAAPGARHNRSRLIQLVAKLR